MNPKRWRMFGAFLAMAAFLGCEQSASEKVQKEQADVVEAQQDVREEQAELGAAEREAREEQPAHEGGPILTLPSDPSADEGDAPPVTDSAEETTPAVPAGNEPSSNDAPNEGDPQAGTAEPAPNSGDGSGSVDQEAGSDSSGPSLPQ